MNKSIVLEVELVSEIHQVKHYEVEYCGKKFSIMLAGTTFNYDGDEIEDIPEQVIDFVEGWIGGVF